MTLSILMPVKSYHPPLLHKAVASVLAQDDQDWRLLVLVEHDTEAHFRQVLADALKDERVEVAAQSRTGIAPPLNHGMRIATSDFVGILLGDDLWAPEAVRVLHRAIAEHPRADSFHSSRRFIDEHDRPLSSVYAARDSFSAADFFRSSPVKHLLCWRRELALAHGGIDESLPSVGPDDYDFPWCMFEWGRSSRP